MPASGLLRPLGLCVTLLLVMGLLGTWDSHPGPAFVHHSNEEDSLSLKLFLALHALRMNPPCDP